MTARSATSASPLRVVHYLNQFFAGLGGEEQASLEPTLLEGARGPGKLLEQLAPELEVVVTVAAGDDFMAQSPDQAAALIEDLLRARFPAAQGAGECAVDVVVVGPAFNAGRYGLGCGVAGEAAGRVLNAPVVGAISPDNPALEEYRGRLTWVTADSDVRGMRAAVQSLGAVGRRVAAGETPRPGEDGVLGSGRRENFFAGETGARRAVSMLLDRIAGRSFETEYPMPRFDRVPPAPAVRDLRNATVALVTSGGIVPRGNPDRIESASASRYGAYDVEGLDRLDPASFQSVHGGYDPTYANADPNRVLPLDVLRELERTGRIGRLWHTYYATVGNSTAVKTAARFGQEIAALLVNVGVQAVIFTST